MFEYTEFLQNNSFDFLFNKKICIEDLQELCTLDINSIDKKRYAYTMVKNSIRTTECVIIENNEETNKDEIDSIRITECVDKLDNVDNEENDMDDMDEDKKENISKNGEEIMNDENFKSYDLFLNCFLNIFSDRKNSEEIDKVKLIESSNDLNCIVEEDLLMDLYKDIMIDVIEINESVLSFPLKSAAFEALLVSNRKNITKFKKVMEKTASTLNEMDLADIFNVENVDYNIKLDYLILRVDFVVKFLEAYGICHDPIFSFSRKIFNEMYILIKKPYNLEEEVVFLFKASYFINTLTGNLIDRTIEIILSKDFMILEENMAEIFKTILYANQKIGTVDKIICLILTTDSILYFKESLKKGLISYIASIIRNTEYMRLLRKMNFTLNEENNENKTLNFLFLLSQLNRNETFGEINSYFQKAISYYIRINQDEEIKQTKNKNIPAKDKRIPSSKKTVLINILKYYGQYLSQSRQYLPLSTFLSNFSTKLIPSFYNDFFRREKSERHIVDFLYFFTEKKERDLVEVLNIIPFIPPRREIFYLLFEIWIFLFKNTNMKNLTFFFMKTPALIGMADSIKKTEDFNFKSFMHLTIEKRIFLNIIIYSERVKLSNFNYTGIIEYITDIKTIKIFKIELLTVIRKIHENQTMKNHDFNTEYLFTLLDISRNKHTYTTTLSLILIIIEHLIDVDQTLIFKKELHFSFKKILRNLINTDLFNPFVILYQKILNITEKTAINFYNYILLCIADINLFGRKFQSHKFNSFSELFNHTYRTMELIDNFPGTTEKYPYFLFNINSSNSIFKQKRFPEEEIKKIEETDESINTMMIKNKEEIENVIEIKNKEDVKNKEESINTMMIKTKEERIENGIKTKDEVKIKNEKIKNGAYAKEIIKKYKNSDIDYFIDVVYVRNNEPHVIRMVVEIIKSRLLHRFTYSDLYLLLKIYNIVKIREEQVDEYLRFCLYKGLDFNCDPNIFLKLSEVTDNLFSYYFSNLYFVCSYSATYKLVDFPKKEDIKLGVEELMIFNNIFRRDRIYELINNRIEHLGYFFTSNLSIIDAITILRVGNNKEFLRRSLEVLKSNDIIFYIPQIIQCLKRKDIYDEIFLTVLELAKDERVSYQLIWNLKANLFKDSMNDVEYKLFQKSIKNLIGRMNEEEILRFKNNTSFLDDLTKLSSSLMPFQKRSGAEKSMLLNEKLKFIEVPEDAYLPLDPNKKIISIVENSARALQSHAKIPFMVTFNVKEEDRKEQISAIFKFGDDCRQDMLALQLVSLFKEIFEDAHLNIFLYPYKVIATEAEYGIIEVVKNAITRDEIGREKINNLVEYFNLKFGFNESKKYLDAIENFISSYTGYSLLGYFLNIKDRHNANIMINDKGQVIHIDFGFMLEISPGNLNLELPLKLTEEINNLLGGIGGVHFKSYVERMFKGFLALRRRSKEIIFLVDSFSNSKLPCFKKNAIKNLISRFKFSLNDEEIKAFITSLIYSSIGTIRTWAYDKFQKVTNDIEF
ncbi:Phosphatidylinositol 4-kinase [Spraguea lophii 42_110]|uniref:1-phosphatidylinositol 4-kinase n=1 Tax=Spraguea lophii (strain 42_110) TaxID=1358809 RepID=S7XRQ4_SPRLO|nr:Phosphatidylinositol 4-kinase [Spraguea lophii 42_110]